LGQNLPLRDGDTIFVTRGEKVFVYGQVRNPGAVTIQAGATLLQVLAMAGGLTERGARTRIKIERTAGGAKKELKAKLSDVVQGGDTIIVPERFF
jgi:polysaccharide export outer membrane protein